MASKPATGRGSSGQGAATKYDFDKKPADSNDEKPDMVVVTVTRGRLRHRYVVPSKPIDFD